MRVRRLVVAIAAAVLAFQGAAEGADPRSSRPTKSSPQSSRSALKKQLSAEASADLQASAESIRAINILLEESKPGPARDRLILNRASALYQYARDLFGASNESVASAKVRGFLQLAIRDCESLLKSSSTTPEVKLSARRIMGFSSVYLDRSAEAKKQFETVLSADSNAPQAGWMALFVAEELFEHGSYAEAARYYSSYQPAMSEPQKELAQYKLAWCEINLGQVAKAQRILLELAKKDTRIQTARDSLRDLAYLVSHQADQDALTPTLAQLKPYPGSYVEFLRIMQATLENQDAVARHEKIVELLLPLEERSEAKLRLLTASLKVSRREYLGSRNLQAFARLRDFIAGQKLSSTSSAISVNGAFLEEELKLLMKVSLATFNGKVRSPDGITELQAGQSLVEQSVLFEYLFPKSELIAELIKVRVETCLTLKNWSCVDRLADRILTDPVRFPESQPESQKDFLERVAGNQLAALRELGDSPDLASRRSAKQDEFLRRWPGSSQWTRVARDRAQQLLSEKSFDAALPILSEVHRREPSGKSLYDFLWASFQVGRYESVLNHPVPAPYRTAEIDRLKREAALKVAALAKEQDQSESYVGHVRKFIAMNDSAGEDASKSDIAREDLYSHLSDKEAHDELSKELMLLPGQRRAQARFEPFVRKSWLWRMDQGDFAGARALVESNPAFVFEAVLAVVASGRVTEQDLLRTDVKPEQSLYLRTLAAVFSPYAAIQYYRKKKAEGDVERGLLEIAIKTNAGQAALTRNRDREVLLGPDYPFVLPESGPALPFERKIASLGAPAKVGARSPDQLFAEVRKIRQRVPSEVKDQPLRSQLRALAAVEALERGTAEFVLASPVPKGLSEAQVAEYQAAIQEAAQEFADQATELRKAIEQARSALEREQQLQARIPGQLKKDTRWPWPQDIASQPRLKGVLASLGRSNWMGALVCLDLAKQRGLLSEEGYVTTRSGVLLYFGSKNAALRAMVYSELEAAGRSDLIETWRKHT